MAELSHITEMGMDLERWDHKSCKAYIGAGENWATIYSIESSEPGKGHASELLQIMKEHYFQKNKKFGSSVALSPEMKHLLKKFDIPEYNEASIIINK